MRNNAGDIVAYIRTGVGQGDPWGTLFFELAIQPSLLRTQEALKAIKIETRLILDFSPHNPANIYTTSIKISKIFSKIKIQKETHLVSSSSRWNPESLNK